MQGTMDLEQVMTDYGDRVLRLCCLMLGDRASAEDAAQETFLRAWRSWGTFDGRSQLSTWLTSIAVNVCRNLLRSPWRRRRVELEGLPEPAGEDASPDDTVARAVAALPSKYREVVVLYYYQDLTTAQIAQLLKVPLGTVHTRLDRGRKQLEPMLKEWYYGG